MTVSLCIQIDRACPSPVPPRRLDASEDGGIAGGELKRNMMEYLVRSESKFVGNVFSNLEHDLRNDVLRLKFEAIQRRDKLEIDL